MVVRASNAIRLALLALVAGCGGPPEDAQAAGAEAESPVTQSEIEQYWAGHEAALRSGDGAAAGAAFTTDAVFVSARGRTEGREAIANLFAQGTQDGQTGRELTFELQKWGAEGDLAYSLSHYTGGVTAPSGHVLAVLRREADGTLTSVAQISMPDAPVP